MRNLVFVLFTTLTLAACNGPKETSATAETMAAAAQPDTVVMVVEKEVAPKDTLVISYERTPCFGRCPVFKVKVYESGFATYEGINFAEKLGLYSGRFTKEEIDAIYQSAVEIHYFDLESVYNDPLISDLPSTKSKINWAGKSHKIDARFNIPAEVKAFHKNLEVTLLEHEWQPFDER